LHDFMVCVNEPLVQYTQHYRSTTSQSSIKQWQDWASIMHADLLASACASTDPDAANKIKLSKRNLISGVTLCVLIQTIGKPGWIRSALRESLRSPGAFFTPYMARRLLKDGHKVLTVQRRSAEIAQQTAPAPNLASPPLEKISQ
jgi:hypothetical protein